MISVDRTAGPPAPRPWHHLPVPVALEELATGREGLPETAAEARREVWGTNGLTFSEPAPGRKVLLHQFAGPWSCSCSCAPSSRPCSGTGWTPWPSPPQWSSTR
ncbi:cation-transporting P-type ATPase [Kocuria sp. CPCC 205316]|uniref:cation-transporting P-type ATPase n=1 Tax=Kocuria TaxID=57493 RepID=UPI0036D774F4